jgi:hypothetical protein
MSTVDEVAKEMYEAGNRAFEKVGRLRGRGWDHQQPHALAAWRAVAKWHMSRLKTVERRVKSANRRNPQRVRNG